MDRITLSSVTWREAPARVLERLTLAPSERPQTLPDLAAALDSDELLYLATCNRVEVVAVPRSNAALPNVRRVLWRTLTGEAVSRAQADRRVRAWAGEGAVEHLFLVAAGMDSAQVGETEIAGQLRSAMDLSDDLGLLGPRLSLVGREALRVARRVHRTTPLGRGHLSLATIALGHVQHRLQRTPGTVALVGVSDMTVRVAKSLAGEGTPFVVVNRTLARAQALCAQIGAGVARLLSAFSTRPDPVEVVLTATGSPDVVLDRAALERLAGQAPSGEPPLIVDLAIPPDVDSDAAAQVGCTRLDMDAVNAEASRTRASRLRGAADARLLVDDALGTFRRCFGERALAPVVAALQRRYRHTAQEAIARLLRRLPDLDAEATEVLHTWAATLAARLAHIPTKGLKNLAAEQGGAAIATFFKDTDAILAAELPPALREDVS